MDKKERISSEGNAEIDKIPQDIAGASNAAALLQLMNKTGFNIVQENGQRKFGPPPNWEGPPPCRGCEIFIGKIPRDCFEDELVPVFQTIGGIYEFRLMMDFSGSNRGYAFVMYTNKDDARKAVKDLNNYEIRKGRFLGVCVSVDNCRLFVGGIPKSKQKEEILNEMKKVTDAVVDVIVYPSAHDKTKNRGFAFVEYESHRAAAMARRKLIPGRIQLWAHQIAVDWAEPEQEVDEDIMAMVKILYVRNLMMGTTEETLKRVFTEATKKENVVERVKIIRDFAFVHFTTREDAVVAKNKLDGTILENSKIEVVFAKPVEKSERMMRKNFSQNSCPHYEPVFCGHLPPQSPRYVENRNRKYTQGRGTAGFRSPPKYVPIPFTYPRTPFRRHPVEVLEELCRKNGWGSPVYQLMSSVSSAGFPLFMYKVTLPHYSHIGNLMQPNRLCRNIDEAKICAAEFILCQLGYFTTEPGSDAAYYALPVPGYPSVLSNVYQGQPLIPNTAFHTNEMVPHSEHIYCPSTVLATTPIAVSLCEPSKLTHHTNTIVSVGPDGDGHYIQPQQTV